MKIVAFACVPQADSSVDVLPPAEPAMGMPGDEGGGDDGDDPERIRKLFERSSQIGAEGERYMQLKKRSRQALFEALAIPWPRPEPPPDAQPEVNENPDIAAQAEAVAAAADATARAFAEAAAAATDATAGAVAAACSESAARRAEIAWNLAAQQRLDEETAALDRCAQDWQETQQGEAETQQEEADATAAQFPNAWTQPGATGAWNAVPDDWTHGRCRCQLSPNRQAPHAHKRGRSLVVT